MSGGSVSTLFTALAVSIAVGFLLPLGAAAAAVRYSRVRGGTVDNYRGVPVPLGLGWAWLAWGLGVLAAAPLLLSPLGAGRRLGVLVAGVALLGLVDDRFGDRATSGFRGHLRALGRGRVTTGLLKVGGIGALALWAAWPLWMRVASPTVVRVGGWLAAAAVVALAANLVNLLDRRPGRALKAYVLLAVAPAVALAAIRPRLGGGVGAVVGALQVAALVFGPVLATWRLDVTERGMLGDMGANAAGALAGWLLARTLPLPALAVAAAVLLALNLASERVSFSAEIEGNRVLRKLDLLGRPKARERAGTVTDRRNGDVI